MWNRLVTILTVSVLISVAVPGWAAAQEQTFRACYVPEVGAMYLIGLSGLPSECLSTQHEEISWTEGGAGVSDHASLTGLAADDHPQYLLTNGVRQATDGFAVTGDFGVGTIPVEGSGSRMMWYPAKNAFRAGSVNGSQWDDPNIGYNSTALGAGVTASGVFTTAIGVGATADAPNSGAISIGINTTATGDASFAFGGATEATGGGSTAIGFGSLASGPYAMALGHETEATTTDATAMGVQTTASGTASTAMGDQTTASGTASTAMGDQTTASGIGSVAMGGGTTASGNGAVAMGAGTTAQADYSVAMGEGAIAAEESSLYVGRYPSQFAPDPDFVPVFVVGNGSSDTNRSFALVAFRDGDVIVGGSLSENSDARLKTDIEPLGTTLDGLRSIRPVRYRFREGTGHPADAQIGLIAQEVKNVFPELVTRDGQGYLSLAYPKLTAVLLKGLQEQQTEIERMESRVSELEDVIRRLEGSGRVAEVGR